jgi:NAD(P)-dependent dehydrogenase (short-subunit alcohol dehydrogenase family)
VLEIAARGREASAVQVDALDETTMQEYVASVISRSGRVDVTMNAIGFSAR